MHHEIRSSPEEAYEISSKALRTLSSSSSLNNSDRGSYRADWLQSGGVITWRDVTVSILGKRAYSSKVIKTCSGYALPGTLTVIMGPPKSGKSTLLRAISGTLPYQAKFYGEVLVNGRKSQLKYGTFGYIGKREDLIENLTVREMLYYSSLIQIPGVNSLEERIALVDNVISTMSLEDCADTYIGGNCHRKTLSFGERRRLSIGRELLTSPQLLFIDEPLYHLDCVSSLLMMVTLRKIKERGCTLIFTMYNSSTEVFGLFDQICLLANGKMLFFGETLTCLQHFANAGYPCPVMQSPSDHFLRAVTTDFDKIIAMCKSWQDEHREFASVKMDTAIAIQTLETTYKSSADAISVETMIDNLTKRAGPILKSKPHANFFKCILVLFRRTFFNMSRDFNYFWLRVVLYLLLMVCIGTVFSKLGHSLYSVRARVSAIFFFISFTSLLSIMAFPYHIKEIEVYWQESASGRTGPVTFLIGNTLASVPFLFLISILCSSVLYFLLELRSEASLFMYFVLNFFLCLLINEGMLIFLATILPKVFEGVVLFMFVQGVMMSAAGYYRLRDELPNAVWKYPLSYLSFHTYATKGILENQYVGTSFPVGQIGSLSGDQALRDAYVISNSSNSKWSDLIYLVVFVVAFRFFLLVSLKIREMLKSPPDICCKRSVSQKDSQFQLINICN